MTGRDGALCGWRVRSDLALGLPEWRDPARPVDLTVTFGEVPEHLPAPAGITPVIETADGICLVRLDGIGRFLVRHGNEVVIAPAPGAPEDDLRIFVLGSVLALICHQRGLIPLHAGCVRIDGRAVALAGQSGAGKSALAAALARRGHAVLADDLTVIDPAPPDGPVVRPIGRGVALYPDIRAALGLAGDWQPLRPGLDKAIWQPAAAPAVDAVPLDRIYLLDGALPGSVEQSAALAATEAVPLLAIHCHARRIAGHLGAAPRLQAALQHVAGQVAVRRLARRFDLARLAAQAQDIEMAAP